MLIILNNYKCSSFFYEDAKYSYKQAYGYFPGVVSIDGIIAYIENRDGNCRIFYIRAIHSASMYSRIQDIREWRRVEIGSQETEVASVMSTQFMEDGKKVVAEFVYRHAV